MLDTISHYGEENFLDIGSAYTLDEGGGSMFNWNSFECKSWI